MEAPDVSGAGPDVGAERVRCCTRCRAIYRSDFLRCPTDGAEIALVAGDPLVGTTIGDHYMIDACVAEGAMGRVYRAHHVRLERKQFAIKVLIGDLASTLAMRLRFAQEAEAASRLDHPNVVSVADYGKSQSGLLYLVMDYVEGPTLSRIIAEQGPLAQDRAVAIARELCRGLAHAHERGLVHRDFKPDNVIVTRVEERDVPRILDFGLAIVEGPAEDAARLTNVGVAVGTPIYAAPEQTSGGTIDHRADLFALGITMYEMLAGVTPFAGNVAEVLYLNATADLPPIAERAPGVKVTPALERIVRKLAHRDPAKRFDSVREVLDAFDAALAGGRAEARRDTEPPPVIVAAPAPAAAAAARSGVPVPIALGVGAVALAIIVGMIVWPRAQPVAPSMSASVSLDAAPPAVTAAGQVDAGEIAGVVPATTENERPENERPQNERPENERPQNERSENGRAHVARTHGGREPGKRSARGSATTPESSDEGEPATPPPAAIDAGEPSAVSPPEPRPSDAGVRAETARRAPPIDAGLPPPRVVGALVAIGSIDLNGSLSVSEVRRPVERALSSISTCYLRAATRAGQSPPGTAHVTLTIDETGEARGVKSSGSPLPGLDGCIAGALSGFRTRSAPDVGTVSVTLDLTLQPEAR